MAVYIQYIFIGIIVAFAIYYLFKLIKDTFQNKNCGGSCKCKKDL